MGRRRGCSGRSLSIKKRKSIDIRITLHIMTVEERRAFLVGLTLKSDMLINPTIDRWRTTLKLATKRAYVAQRCYYALFKFIEDCRGLNEIYNRISLENYVYKGRLLHE